MLALYDTHFVLVLGGHRYCCKLPLKHHRAIPIGDRILGAYLSVDQIELGFGGGLLSASSGSVSMHRDG